MKNRCYYGKDDTFIDRKGNVIKVGDFIEFLFWTNAPWGEIETYIRGKLVYDDGTMKFKYRLDGKVYRKSLNVLTFVSEDDWEKIEWDSWKFPENKIRPVIYQIQ